MKHIDFKISKKWMLFLVAMPIIFTATTCGPDEEFVFVKNNSNKSIFCIPNFNEDSSDSLPKDIRSWLDYSLVVEPNNSKVMVLYEKRKKVFKNSSKVYFFFLPVLKLQGTESIDTIRNNQDKYILKRSYYTKSELEALDWTITYP